MLDEERYQAIRKELQQSRPDSQQVWEFWARMAKSMAQAFELAAEQAGQQESSSKPPRS